MEDSILTSVKKTLGIEEDYEHFDEDIILHINSVFATLNQLGIGPDHGFQIEDKTDLWSTYLDGNFKFNSVKTYMYLKVRILFDPPSSSFHLTALEKQAVEFEWRLSEVREETEWTNPNQDVEDEDDLVLDGGDP